jgi:hypothetical protein
MSTWTTTQERMLRDLYPSVPKLEVERALAPHSWRAIRSRAAELNIKRSYIRRDWHTVCQNHVMQTGLFKVGA